jgi:hypothetical protein
MALIRGRDFKGIWEKGKNIYEKGKGKKDKRCRRKVERRYRCETDKVTEEDKK